MQVVLFRCRRRETDVSKVLVSRRADELDRFQKWSETPAAVEVREARVTGDTAYVGLPLYRNILSTKVFLRREIGADDPLLFHCIRSDRRGSGAAQTRQSVLFGRQLASSNLSEHAAECMRSNPQPRDAAATHAEVAVAVSCRYR
ncbi:hypothetical protein SVAN01_05626 [Stagonosporopsis vannaccii]|nr:hypothetical protein SVAN01_05626 [Stagonosporopsis vannaccii]